MARTGLINPGQGCSGSLGAKVFLDPDHRPLGSVPARPPSVLPVWVPSAPACGLPFLPTWITFLERFSPIPIPGPTVHPQSLLGRTAHPVWEATACHLAGCSWLPRPWRPRILSAGASRSRPASPSAALETGANRASPARDSGRPAVGGASARGRGLCYPSRHPPLHSARSSRSRWRGWDGL